MKIGSKIEKVEYRNRSRFWRPDRISKLNSTVIEDEVTPMTPNSSFRSR